MCLVGETQREAKRRKELWEREERKILIPGWADGWVSHGPWIISSRDIVKAANKEMEGQIRRVMLRGMFM